MILKDENNKIIANNVELSNTFITRFIGLMGRNKDNFPKDSAMLFDKCSSIHMFFMKIPLDIIYLDKKMNVLKIVRNIKPWKVDFGCKDAYFTIELNASTIDDTYSPKKIYLE